MIANEFQYNLTRSQAARFAQALERLDGRAPDTGGRYTLYCSRLNGTRFKVS